MAKKVSYGQFCPVAKACEVFAERWTPLPIARGEILVLEGHAHRQQVVGDAVHGGSRTRRGAETFGWQRCV